jgi:c-di-GMP-binding flagellar brake protein YcgR
MSPRKGGPKIERRRSIRADANLSMRVEGQPSDGDLTKIVTESQNISASGVYCTSPHYLAPLSKVALTIILPNRASRRATDVPSPRKLLKCDGIVVRCMPSNGTRQHGYELACSFVGLDSRHRDVIEEFVSWRNLESMGREMTGPPTRRTATRSSRKPVRAASRTSARATTGSTAKRTQRSRPARAGRSSGR